MSNRLLQTLDLDPDESLPDFGGFHKGGFNVTMGDGSVRFISEEVADEVLRDFLTPSCGELSNHGKLDPKTEDE